VLDAVAAVARAVGFGDGFEHIERNPIRAIANRVERKLKTGLVAGDRHFPQLAGSLVRIPLVEDRRSTAPACSGARTHGAIRERLQRTGLHPRIRSASLRAHIWRSLSGKLKRQPFGDSNGELFISASCL